MTISNHPIIQSSNSQSFHVAIIMDGNGRWAQKRGLPRSAGHKQGAEAVRKIVKAAAEEGINYLTLFGFSAENWNRPESEVQELMKLLRYYLRSETADLHKNGAKLRVIGDRAALDEDIVELINNAESLTAKNDKITVIIALNYGGRQEILQAAKAAALETKSGGDFDKAFSAHLMTADIPDPDMIIRTSGEQRLSNFLLWQSAYSEMVFSDVLWPDFKAEDLRAAIIEYESRDRRFGALKSTEA